MIIQTRTHTDIEPLSRLDNSRSIQNDSDQPIGLASPLCGRLSVR
jgi:hypothetical protein